jgi:PhnB protein
VHLNPYLHFNGQCEIAFKYYERVLGGKIKSMARFAGTPMEKSVPPEWAEKIIHAHLAVGDEAVLGSDPPPGRYEQPKGFSVSLDIKSPADADRIFQALAENGKVTMPVQNTYWAERFGMCTDQFGIPWIVNCAKAT